MNAAIGDEEILKENYNFCDWCGSRLIKKQKITTCRALYPNLVFCSSKCLESSHMDFIDPD